MVDAVGSLNHFHRLILSWDYWDLCNKVGDGLTVRLPQQTRPAYRTPHAKPCCQLLTFLRCIPALLTHHCIVVLWSCLELLKVLAA